MRQVLFDAMMFGGIDGLIPDQERPQYALRPARTIFEACAIEGQQEERACDARGELMAHRVCRNGRWSLWSPCADAQTMCCERGEDGGITRCLSPMDGHAYRWVVSGNEIRQLELFSSERCSSDEFYQQNRYQNEQLIYCDPTTLGLSLIHI